jgi:hypothetical protein
MASQLPPDSHAPPKPGRPPNPPPEQPPTPRAFLVWLSVMIILIIWNVLAFWPKQNLRVRLPYNAFLAQVRTGNVAEVSLSEDEIAGTFRNPVEWPPKAEAHSKENSGPASPPASGQSTGTKPAEQQNQATHTYKAFQTIFPRTISDPGRPRQSPARRKEAGTERSEGTADRSLS